MSNAEAAAGEKKSAPMLYAFEFRGTGSEYFRIWIVNLALTILTLGVFSAWAKVRTWRYFYGNTFVGDHALDYHASPWRILIGRAIAVSLFVGYEVSVAFKPVYALPWFLIAGFAFPWLVIASLRFNARNTSYRNVRFNFVGKYFEALVAYVIWPLAGMSTLFLLMPAARRARDFYFTNHHTFGGRRFHTEFTPWNVYSIYLFAFFLLVTLAAAVGAAFWANVHVLTKSHNFLANGYVVGASYIAVIVLAYLAFLMLAPAINTMVVNLSLNNTMLDGRHKVQSRMSPLVVAWISVTNGFLVLITLGIFYPWARVRLRRYETRKLALLMDGDIDEYASEAFATQSAVGEEIGSFFAFDFGL
ncbi:MAG: YjgN family protein [Rhizomicrobium sp.]